MLHQGAVGLHREYCGDNLKSDADHRTLPGEKVDIILITSEMCF